MNLFKKYFVGVLLLFIISLFFLNSNSVFAEQQVISINNSSPYYQYSLSGQITLNDYVYYPGDNLTLNHNLTTCYTSMPYPQTWPFQVAYKITDSPVAPPIDSTWTEFPAMPVSFSVVPSGYTVPPGGKHFYIHFYGSGSSGNCYNSWLGSFAYLVTNTSTPTTSLVSSKYTVYINEPFTMSWWSTATTSCSLSRNGNVVIPNAGTSGSSSFSTQANTNFTLTCGVVGGGTPISNTTGVNVIDPPTIVSPTATEITTSSAKLGAVITSLGIPASLTRRGFCIGPNINPGYSYPDYPDGTPNVACHDVAGGGTGIFNYIKTGLVSNVTYNYRGYGENSSGVRYTNNAVFTTTSNPLTVTLSKQENKEKEVVKAGVTTNEDIGKVFFEYTMSGKTTEICKLKNMTSGVELDKLLINGEDEYENLSNLTSSQNNFRIECKSGETLVKASDPISAEGQSGTMNSPSTCTIPLGGNSCTTSSFTWTVISPRGTDPTIIRAQGDETTPEQVYTSAGGPNNSGNIQITLQGSRYMKMGHAEKTVVLTMLNKVDGTNSSSSVDNPILSKNINIHCNEGSWNGSICANEPATGPDLFAYPTTPTSAPVGNVTLTSVIKNIGTAPTGGTFPNFFQYSTVDPNQGQTPIARKFKIFDLFRKVNADEQTLFDLTPYYTIGPLAVNAPQTISHTHNFSQARTYWVRACADKRDRNYPGDISELYEGNNCSFWTKMIVYNGEQPDLIVDSFAIVSTQNPNIKRLNAVIKNQGNLTTGRNFYNIFQRSTVNPGLGPVPLSAITDLTPSDNNPMPTLAAQAQRETYFGNYAYSGNSWARACADKANKNDLVGVIPEADEENNCSDWMHVYIGTTQVNGVCAATHYNCLSGISDSPREYTDKYTWVCLGINGGSDVGCFENKPPIMTGDLIPLAESCAIEEGRDSCMIKFDWWVTNPVVQTTTVTNSSGVQVGSGHPGKDVEFLVKYNQESFELKNNNQILDKETVNSYCALETSWNGTVCATIVPPLQPDLEAEPPMPTNDIPAKVAREYTANIVNRGDGPVLFGFNNLFQTATDKDDESTIMDHTADHTLGPLGAGDSAIARVTITFDTQGTYQMRACADKKDKNDPGGILESDEDDNCSDWVTINVTAPLKPDLVANFIGPRDVLVKDTNKFKATITNQGPSPASGVFYNLFQIGKQDNDSKSKESSAGAKEEPGAGMDLGKDDSPEISVIANIPDAGISSLGAGVPISTFVNYTFETQGTYYMRTCADKRDQSDVNGNIDEGDNEENNCSHPWTQINVLAEGTPMNGLCSVPPAYNTCLSGEAENGIEYETYYTWNCVGKNNGSTAECTQLKPGPGGISIIFKAEPARILRGRSSTLKWQISGNAQHCQLLGEDGESLGEINEFNSSEKYSPDTTTTYEISCENEEGEVVKEEATVRVINLFFQEI
jgi:hypothetical protein